MAKRDPQQFISKAESQIDAAWRQLPIFRSDRASALLKVVTATDDRLRLALLKNTPLGMIFSQGLRYGQDALRFAIPWIFQTCTQTGRPVPTGVSEVDYLEGAQLAEYAFNYDSATIAFTNYHRRRYLAHVASKDRRITFAFARGAAATAELQKRAYEVYELETTLPAFTSTKEQLAPLLALKGLVTKKMIREEGDRVALPIDDDLVGILRQVREAELSTRTTEIDDGQKFCGVSYGEMRRYFASLLAYSNAHDFLHREAALRNIPSGAVSSLALRATRDCLQALVAKIGELRPTAVKEISELLTYDGSIPTLDPICQPLIQVSAEEVLIPRVFSAGSRFERNLLKLLAKNPRTKREYDRFSSGKENIALPNLVSLLHQHRVSARDRITIKQGGRAITDVDILAFDPQGRCLLAIQHKWLIEPDSVNESKACDEQLAEAIKQARTARDYLGANKLLVKELLPEFEPAECSRLEALVISKGLEPTGFLDEADVAIVTELWFRRNLASCSGLGALYDLARSRPDRLELVKDWVLDKETVRIADYQLVVPSMGKLPSK